jgi:hypothetical protein
MADIVFNIAKGKVARYADLPDASDALIIVLLKTAGIEADGALQDHATLSALLAAANDEADFTGYSRKTLASVVSTPDNTNNRMDSDAADPSSYTNSGGASQVTFDIGVATTLQFNASGFFRAS